MSRGVFSVGYLFQRTQKWELFPSSFQGLSQKRGLKVCVLGAMGNVGQPLSLLMKMSPWFEELALFDKVNCKGLVLELSQVDTSCRVTGCEGSMKTVLKGAHIVLNAAGAGGGSKPCAKKDESFAHNARSVLETARECAKVCPQAFHVVLASPVNSMVPIVCEVYKQVTGCVDPGRIFGMTAVDSLRACSLVSDLTHTDPEKVSVPVVGGHSSTTTVPLLSRAQPCLNLSTDETIRITRAVQSAEDEVHKAKEGKGSATLSVAHATAHMAESLAKGFLGQKGVVVCSYVMSNLIPDISYFASPIQLGPTGVQKISPLPNPLSNYECCLLESAIECLKSDIEKGVKYATI